MVLREAPELPAGQPTTPTASRRHFAGLRGQDVVPQSEVEVGRYGRMFRNAPLFEHQPADLSALAAKMLSPEEDDPNAIPDDANHPQVNQLLPAGYTYLGQFIDHDITFDPVSLLDRQNDPDALTNFRTPRLDLDCVYGRGPADQPYLYVHERGIVPHPTLGQGCDLNGITFRLGEFVADPNNPQQAAVAGPDLPRDLPHTPTPARFVGRALIGDPRNDENLIVSQLHLAFLKFHNKVVETVAEQTPLRNRDLFKEAQRVVRWHYQWVVVHDFLRRVVGDDVIDDILRPVTYRVAGHDIDITRPRLLFYRHPGRPPFIPVEWSVAAYRFGHSMVRPSYFFNDLVAQAAGRTVLFKEPDPPDNELDQLNGFRRLPPQWGFQWKFYFDVEPGFTPQKAFKIDTQVANPLGQLRPEVAIGVTSLPERNLLRGLALGVPSGQTVARAMGIQPLAADQLDLADLAPDLAVDTPLWYYILKEAEVEQQGQRLGSVGGRIVAEVIIGLVAADPLSFLNVAPAFQPERPFSDSAGKFDMPQLIRFAFS